MSGDATIAGGGALTIGDNKIGNDELKQDDDITLQSLTTTNNVTIGGDLVVNGTTTTVATTNTKVEDKFMFSNIQQLRKFIQEEFKKINLD